MTDTPKKRGRPKKTPVSDASSSPAPEVDLFAVQSVTAHRPLNLLEVQDATDLDALLLDSRLKGFVVSRLSPTFALLSHGSEKQVLDALRKAGHTPKVQGGGA